MQFMTVYLNFKGDAEEAFEFYRTVFGGDYSGLLRFRDFGEDAMGVPEAERDKIAHVSLPLANGIGLMGSDVVGPVADAFNAGNNVYIYLETDSGAEAESLFERLSAGGTVEMPLQATEWAEMYAVLRDRFGVGWMISFTGDVEFSL